MLDLAIIGSGPAALTAAIYAARAGLSVTVFERGQIGGLLNEIFHLANFPGFDGSGAEFATILKEQAISVGAKITYGECTKITPDGQNFSLIIDEEPVSAHSVLVATGSEPKRLDFSLSTPVSYCATCDAPLYAGKNIAVVGGGNSAVGESLHLTDLASHLTIFSDSALQAEAVRLDDLKSRPNVTIHEHRAPNREELEAFDGVFVFIGKLPATAFLPTSVLDPDGYILTDANQMTSTPGIFAAGDVRAGSTKQAITAAADGANAAISIQNYLKA